jgi:tetratricopeptide (TPR) repeat protein
VTHNFDGDRAAVLSHLRRRAIAGIYVEFNYRGAERDADELLRLASGRTETPDHLGESELLALQTAHKVKAVILRDRSSAAADLHFDAATVISDRLDDHPEVIELNNQRITGLLNRGDLNGAARRVLAALQTNENPPAATLRRAAAVLESAGHSEAALRLLAKPAVRDPAGSERIADLTRLARLENATALSQTASRARQLRRGALAKLDIIEPALRAMDERVFRLTAAATRGLVLLDSGDRRGAIDAADEAAEFCRTIAIRNRWSENLASRLGDPIIASRDPLASMWARYWRFRLSDTRLAFEELARGWEYLLRCAASLGGMPKPGSVGLKRLSAAAHTNLAALGVGDLADILPADTAERHLRFTRNAAAHEISPELDFGAACLQLESAVRRLEDLLDVHGDL